jgi:putative acyl-CoA dehydrogenase
MTNLLADLCIEAEANSLTAFYLSSLYDSVASSRLGKAVSANDVEVEELFRIAVTVGKYWVTKRLPNFTYECMEVLHILLTSHSINTFSH